MFSPRFIFFLLWFSQIVLHMVFNDIFNPFEDETWFVIGFGFLSFFVGTICIQLIFINDNHVSLIKNKTVNINYEIIVKCFTVLYIPIFLYVIYSAQKFLVTVGLAGFDGAIIRQMVIDDFNGDRYIYGLFRYLYTGVGCCIFLLSFSDKLSKKYIVLLVVLGVVSALATTGRLFLLLFFSSVVALLYKNKVITIKTVIIFLLMFVFLFFAAAIFLGKGAESSGDKIGSGILWNAQIYIMSSISCFNAYVSGDVGGYDGSVLIPNQVKILLSNIGIDIPLRPALNPFAYVPEPCNTYTILFPLYHDAGFFGIGIGLFFIGGIHQFIYQKYKFSQNRVWWYIYAISIYPLMMTIFEDAYFSSIGFWLLLWVPVVAYMMLLTIKKIER